MFVSEAVIKQKFTQVNFAELQLQACLDELAFNGKTRKGDRTRKKSELVSNNLGDSVLRPEILKLSPAPNHTRLSNRQHLCY